jgi:hypothetical protein
MDLQIGGLFMEQTIPTPRAQQAMKDVGRNSDPLAQEIENLLELDDAALRQR